MSRFFDVDAWRACREDFERVREAAYAAASEATAGNLLNARGRAAGVDAYELFMGPAARANAYASEELLAWWALHGRPVFADFEAGWPYEPAWG